MRHGLHVRGRRLRRRRQPLDAGVGHRLDAACADTQPPTAPRTSSPTSRTATSIALSWSASSDNVGVAGYGLYRGGSQVGTSSTHDGDLLRASPATRTTPSPSTPTTRQATARRRRPSWSRRPRARIRRRRRHPTGLAASNVTQTGLTLAWNASTDNVGVTGYDVYRNGTKMATTASTSSSQTGLACGTSYTFGVVARDAAGNSSTQAQITGSTAACALAPPPSGTTFYVDPNGSDSTGTGTLAKPWRSVKKACDTVTSGLISLAAGTYVESGTCALKSGVSLVGAGSASTTVRPASAAVPRLLLVQNTTGAQTISDLRLDGQSRTTGDYGIWVQNATGLTITRVDVTGFKGPNDFTGGGINVIGATDFVLSHSTLSNNASSQAGYCSGELGLGGLTRADIHHLTITAPQGYAVKMTSSFGVSRDVTIRDSRFDAQTSTCSMWNTLAVELWWDATNCVFRNNWLNRTLSLPEGGPAGAPAGASFRWRIHNNEFAISGGNEYAIEAGIDYTVVDHNFFNGVLYPLGHITRETSRITSRFTTTSSTTLSRRLLCGTTYGRSRMRVSTTIRSCCGSLPTVTGCSASGSFVRTRTTPVWTCTTTFSGHSPRSATRWASASVRRPSTTTSSTTSRPRERTRRQPTHNCRSRAGSRRRTFPPPAARRRAGGRSRTGCSRSGQQ